MRYIVLILTIAAIAAFPSCSRSPSSDATTSYYFKDTVDSGNDAATAGCHVEYLTNTCDANRVVGVKGDSCLSTASVNEYTNNTTCHQHNANTSPADISALNCDEICGSKGGKCETVANACTVGTLKSDSARCVCNP